MSERETSEAINDRAAAWVARIDLAPLDHAAQAEFDGWLAGDDRRRGAFFRAQVAWRMLDRASLLESQPHETPQPGDAANDEPAAPGMARRHFLTGGAIAATMVATAGGYALWQHPGQKIETALGEFRRVPLQDGSIADLNTATRVAVRLEPEIRNIRLDEGEAWFQVAKDRARPFVVAAGDVRVRAVGTAFSVRRQEDGADVQVTEGVVEVWTVGREDDRRRIAAGARSFVSFTQGPAAPVDAADEIDRTLAWRSGQLVFDGDTLADAAAEFNRYNAIRLEVDEALAGEKVVGRFRTNEPEAFARAASTMFGARAVGGPDGIRLSRN